MVQFSAVIITYNEERNIARCLDSVKDVAAEIVVVDSFSNDKTEEICRGYGVRFIQNSFRGHIEQKNFALDQARHDFVLSLDADEALSSTLINALRNLPDVPLVDGYSFNRLSNYCGKWIKHGSWYPDVKMRLFNRNRTRWSGINPHDKAEFTQAGKCKHLEGDILHYTYNTVEEHIGKLDYFSTIAAKAYYERGKKASLFNLWINPSFAFFRDYFLRLGFLDGYYGWLIARLTAYYTFQKYAKLRFIQSSNS